MSKTTPATAEITVPFQRVLRLGSTGTEPVGVKRGLWRAGFRSDWTALDGAAVSAKVFGPLAVRNLRAFQKARGLTVDGVYGPATHALVQWYFDDYARELYETDPQGGVSILLPRTFTPTHQTAGLPGYPAVDVFAAPGTRVLAPEDGEVTRLSGHDPKDGGVPGGAFGWSVYLTVPHAIYFLTHFATRTVRVGDRVKQGEMLGTVCDASVAHMPRSSSHIHCGKHVE